LDHFALIPSVISQSQTIGARLKDFVGYCLCKTKATGGILRIDCDEIQLQAALKLWQLLAQHNSACTPNYVSKKGYSHDGQRYAPLSVIIQSSR
jgi:hypothetical protein